MWSTDFSLKKTFYISLSSKTGYTVDLRQFLTNQYIDKSKVKIFTFIENIDLPYLSTGYGFDIIDVYPNTNVPVYNIKFYQYELGDFKTLARFNPKQGSSQTFSIPSGVSTLMLSGGAKGGRNKNVSIDIKLDGNTIFQKSVGQWNPFPIYIPNTINLDMYKTHSISFSFNSNNECDVYVKGHTVKKVYPNAKIGCLFLIGDD